MDATPALVIQVQGAVAIIRFNRPAARNPLSISTLNELADAVSSLTQRKEVKAIVLTGSEGVFASGADIRELAKLDQDRALEFAKFGQKLFAAIAVAAQLTIAAIDGYCMGGGLDLALACDLRIASARSTFRHPGARLGIITGWGGTQRLPQLVGRARAFEVFLTTRMLTGEAALQLGLITQLDSAPLERAIQLAESAPPKQ